MNRLYWRLTETPKMHASDTNATYAPIRIQCFITDKDKGQSFDACDQNAFYTNAQIKVAVIRCSSNPSISISRKRVGKAPHSAPRKNQMNHEDTGRRSPNRSGP